MVTEVIMPKMGQTMEKGKIIRWLKNEGERVERGEPLLEIETDKTTIEVEARDSGTLKKILVQGGEEAPIAATIAYITGEGETLPDEEILRRLRTPEPSSAKILEETSKSALIPREITKARAVSRIRASPLAKKIGEEKGVDLTQVEGTGPGGRITKKDVLKHLAGKAAEPSPEFQVVSMTSMRRAIAEKMVESKSHVPHFYVSTEVDMTEATKLRKKLNPTLEAESGIRLSFTHMLVKAVAMTLEEYPQLNSTLEEENIKIWKDINIGIAVSLEDGLIVPVLRNANKKSLLEITSKASKLASRARKKRLREEEFSGGTFTISNMGAYDVASFIAIINVPETAILAVGKINNRPTVVEEKIVIRKMMTMTLSADHRVVDGVLAAKFLQKVKMLLEDPSNLTS